MAGGISSTRARSGYKAARQKTAAAAAPPKFYGSFGFFPALPLQNELALGDWVVGSPPANVRWDSSEFQTLSTSLYDSFAPRFTGGAKLWHRDEGFNGTAPDLDVLRAIQAAVTFAVLDVNDRVQPENRGNQLATTENAELFLQPIYDRITHLRAGWLRREHVGGWPIGKGAPPLADAVFPLQLPVPVCNRFAALVYDFLREGTDHSTRVALTMEWHRLAMSNPAAITLQQRIVALKTGFEVLLGESGNSRLAATKLRTLFEEKTLGYRDHFPWSGVLWSPDERTVWWWWWEGKKKQARKKLDPRSELEDWFMALADVRNKVIHEGRLLTDTYEAPSVRPKSRYAGELFWIGERMLREAIKATIGPHALLCGPITAAQLWQQTVGTPAGVTGVIPPPAPQPAAATDPEPPPLSTLLRVLGCRYANEVTLCPPDQPTKPDTFAFATRDRHTDDWDSDPNWIEVTRCEYDLLKNAGAEDELPNLWYPCR
jgi:hypothetical protein